MPGRGPGIGASGSNSPGTGELSWLGAKLIDPAHIFGGFRQ